jgi:hypothetical protein
VIDAVALGECRGQALQGLGDGLVPGETSGTLRRYRAARLQVAHRGRGDAAGLIARSSSVKLTTMKIRSRAVALVA